MMRPDDVVPIRPAWVVVEETWLVNSATNYDQEQSLGNLLQEPYKTKYLP